MFFKDIKDYKQYVSVNASFKFEEMEHYLKDVDRSIFRKYLSKDFLEALQDLYDASLLPQEDPESDSESDSEDDDTDVLNELMEALRISSANLALVKWIPLGQVSIDQGGIRINSTENQKTAFPWQIRDIERVCAELGYNALEEALAILEKNPEVDAFAIYFESDEWKENQSLFLSSSAEFSKHYSAFNNSRINFYKIRSIIRKVEDFEIKAVILPDLYDDLKDKLQGTEDLEDTEKKIIEMIKPAVAHLVISRAVYELSASINPQGFFVFDNTAGGQTLDSKKQASTVELTRIGRSAEIDGKVYLDNLKTYLEAHKDDYELYKEDSLYVDPDDETDLNTGDNNFFAGM